MVKNLSYRHILKYTGLFGTIQAISVLSSILRNKAAATLIDRYGQGLSDLFNSTANLISTATTLIIPVSIVQRLSYIHQNIGSKSFSLRTEIKVVRSWAILTGLIGTSIMMILSPILSQLTHSSPEFVRSYFFLSPIILLMSINATEIAILKATHHLKSLAVASVLGSVSTMAVCIISYYFLKTRGIIPALLLSVLFMTLLNLRYTLPRFRYSIAPFKWRLLRMGGPLIKLSISFLLASVASAFSEILIRTQMSHSGSIENVGLYAAGFALTVTYTKFIFSAMDADYFPRLTGICHDIKQMNNAINKQIQVCVQLIVPCLLLFILFLPYFISILYTSKYLEVLPMVQFATFFIFCKAIITPVAYVSLAKADSKMYLTMETISAIVLALCVIGGYRLDSLRGCGIGLSVSYIIESAIIISVYRYRYKVKFSPKTICTIAGQLVLLVFGLYIVIDNNTQMHKYLTVIPLALISALSSFLILRSNKES